MDYLPAYHVTHFAAGQSASNAVIFKHVFSRAARLPSGTTLSRAVAGVAATGPFTFAPLKNGTPVGAVQFAAEEAVASFSVAAAVDFGAGDVLAIAASDPQDATLAHVALTSCLRLHLITRIAWAALIASVAPPAPCRRRGRIL